MSGSVNLRRRASARLATILKAAAPAIAFLAALTIAMGCGGSSGNPVPMQPALTIVSPANGTTVNTGQTVSITVQASGAAAFTRGVVVIGGLGLGATAIDTKPPYNFTLAIPADLTPGSYSLTALGYGAGVEPVTSTSITVDVESSSALLTLLPPSREVILSAIGEQLPLRIAGTDAAGKLLDLTRSSHVLYTSTNPAIAAVDKSGMVTAVAPGQASIALTLNKGGAGSVPIRVIAPALLPSATSLDFGTEAAGKASAVKSLTLTNNAAYPLRILAVNSPANFPETDDCLSKSPLPVGGSCTVKVGFAPAKTGAANGILSIADSAVIARTQIFLTGTGH